MSRICTACGVAFASAATHAGVGAVGATNDVSPLDIRAVDMFHRAEDVQCECLRAPTGVIGPSVSGAESLNWAWR